MAEVNVENMEENADLFVEKMGFPHDTEGLELSEDQLVNFLLLCHQYQYGVGEEQQGEMEEEEIGESGEDMVDDAEEDVDEEFRGRNTRRKRIDKAETARRNYENMRKMVGSGGIAKMSKETMGLMKQQKNLISNMEQLRPMATEAKSLLDRLENSKLLNTMATNKSNFTNAKNSLGNLKI